MKAVIKTNDPLLVSFVLDLFKKEGIKAFEFDQNFSVMEGSIGIFPRRIMVIDDELERARELLKEAGLGHELEPQKKPSRASKRPWIRRFLSIER